MRTRDTHVRVHLEDGSFWATVDEFPGVFATGDTLEELRESLQEGISLWLAEPSKEPPRVQLGRLQSEPTETVASAELALAS